MPRWSRKKRSSFRRSSRGSPSPAISNGASRFCNHQLADQGRLAQAVAEDLNLAYSEGQGGRGTLDFLKIVSEPSQTASHYRAMLTEVQSEYLEFSRPPYAVDPLEEQLVKQAVERGVKCRLLVESGRIEERYRARLNEYAAVGVEIRKRSRCP